MSSSFIDVPYLTARQMAEVDRTMMDGFHIELIQMMENAGRSLACLARSRFLNGNALNKKVIVLAGAGGNGGGALVCSRHLHNWGAKVEVFVTRPPEALAPVPAHQLDILRRMQVSIYESAALGNIRGASLVIDGIIGYSIAGAPHGAAADMIRWANSCPAPILALDIPSGVDATTGEVFEPAIRATATMTLALPKEGLRTPDAREKTGELYLADIGVPPELLARPPLSLKPGAVFSRDEIVRLS